MSKQGINANKQGSRYDSYGFKLLIALIEHQSTGMLGHDRRNQTRSLRDTVSELERDDAFMRGIYIEVSGVNKIRWQ